MGRKAIYDYEALAAILFTRLAEKEEGASMKEIVDFLGVPSRHVATKVITRLRLDLGEGDTITVPVIRKGRRHFYVLSGVYDDAKAWFERRARFLYQFIKTENAAYESLFRGTDGRTKDGKSLALALRDAQRLEEDLGAYLMEVEEVEA